MTEGRRAFGSRASVRRSHHQTYRGGLRFEASPEMMAEFRIYIGALRESLHLQRPLSSLSL